MKNLVLHILIGITIIGVVSAYNKPGKCPKPIGFGTCVEECSGDDGCPGDEKCCSNGCGHVCMKPVSGIPKPGKCPKPGFGFCVELCDGDNSCPGDEKCCSNGCGHECRKPVPGLPKPGNCPKPAGAGICVEACSGDNSCPGIQKCCSNGCGHVCMNPAQKPDPGDKAISVKECLTPKIIPQCVVILPAIECREDSECPAKKKCCLGLCNGRVCRKIKGRCKDSRRWKATAKYQSGGKTIRCRKCTCAEMKKKSRDLMTDVCRNNKKGAKTKCCKTCSELLVNI